MTNEDEQRWFALIPEQIRSINVALAEGDFDWQLPWDEGRNRWAAFTDDELWTLAGGDWGTDDAGTTLHAEIDAEIERRRP